MPMLADASMFCNSLTVFPWLFFLKTDLDGLSKESFSKDLAWNEITGPEHSVAVRRGPEGIGSSGHLTRLMRHRVSIESPMKCKRLCEQEDRVR